MVTWFTPQSDSRNLRFQMMFSILYSSPETRKRLLPFKHMHTKGRKLEEAQKKDIIPNALSFWYLLTFFSQIPFHEYSSHFPTHPYPQTWSWREREKLHSTTIFIHLEAVHWWAWSTWKETGVLCPSSPIIEQIGFGSLGRRSILPFMWDSLGFRFNAFHCPFGGPYVDVVLHLCLGWARTLLPFISRVHVCKKKRHSQFYLIIVLLIVAKKTPFLYLF